MSKQGAEGWTCNGSDVEQALATLTSPELVQLLARCNNMPVALAYKALVDALSAIRAQAP
jgi:hypothetical protein